MSAWDHKGRYTRDEDEGTESDPSRSVLERWHLLNIMHAPGITDSFYRALSKIAEVCPPGNELKKGRRRLAEDAGISLRNVERFYEWAYETGVMERKRGKRGFSDKVWPNYDAWLDYAAKRVQGMSDPERRSKEADRLAAFGIALGKDEAWARRLRELMTPDKQSVPPDKQSVPTDRRTGGVPTETTPPLPTDCRTRTESLTGLSDRKREQVRENGPEPEQAPLRASHPSSLFQGPSELKTTTRAEHKKRERETIRSPEARVLSPAEQEAREDPAEVVPIEAAHLVTALSDSLRLDPKKPQSASPEHRTYLVDFFRNEKRRNGSLKPFPHYDWLPKTYSREDMLWAYNSVLKEE